MLAEVRRRYGLPRELLVQQQISRAERDLVLASGRSGRRHDITFFVRNGGRIAFIR